MKKLTTALVAERLGVSQAAVKKWCQKGHFPNTKLVDTPRGPFWEIPESDLRTFKRPRMGRPVSAKPSLTKRAVKRKMGKKR